jgi:hypothetical protein
LDPRSCYDVTDDGIYPIPNDYVGRLAIRHRVVEIKSIDRTHAVVRNVHDGRQSRISLRAFHDRHDLQQGFVSAP